MECSQSMDRRATRGSIRSACMPPNPWLHTAGPDTRPARLEAVSTVVKARTPEYCRYPGRREIQRGSERTCRPSRRKEGKEFASIGLRKQAPSNPTTQLKDKSAMRHSRQSTQTFRRHPCTESISKGPDSPT